MHDSFFKNYITIENGDSEIKLNKDSIFGYRDNHTISHRFFNKNIYTILNPGEEILLYSKESLSTGKGSPAIKNYYFSKNFRSPVLELSIGNLKIAFKDNISFCEILNTYFKVNADIPEYDSAYKMYKLNYLLLLSKQLHQVN